MLFDDEEDYEEYDEFDMDNGDIYIIDDKYGDDMTWILDEDN